MGNPIPAEILAAQADLYARFQRLAADRTEGNTEINPAGVEQLAFMLALGAVLNSKAAFAGDGQSFNVRLECAASVVGQFIGSNFCCHTHMMAELQTLIQTVVNDAQENIDARDVTSPGDLSSTKPQGNC